MTVRTLSMPTEFRRAVEYRVSRLTGRFPGVKVTPRDKDEHRCAAWCADHYEVQAYYTDSTGSFAELEEALRTITGVYLTTQVTSNRDGAEFSNPDWPGPLGAVRGDSKNLRSQVIALVKDPEPSAADGCKNC